MVDIEVKLMLSQRELSALQKEGVAPKLREHLIGQGIGVGNLVAESHSGQKPFCAVTVTDPTVLEWALRSLDTFTQKGGNK